MITFFAVAVLVGAVVTLSVALFESHVRRRELEDNMTKAEQELRMSRDFHLSDVNVLRLDLKQATDRAREQDEQLRVAKSAVAEYEAVSTKLAFDLDEKAKACERLESDLAGMRASADRMLDQINALRLEAENARGEAAKAVAKARIAEDAAYEAGKILAEVNRSMATVQALLSGAAKSKKPIPGECGSVSINGTPVTVSQVSAVSSAFVPPVRVNFSGPPG